MLCGSIGEKTVKNCIKKIKKAEEDGADIIEIRLDILKEKDNLAEIISYANVPVIATCRKGSQKILIEAIDAGAKYIDMDIKELDEEVLKYAKRKKCVVILSYHDFKKTPPRKALLSMVDKLKKSRADVIKIVALANSEKDNQNILSLYEETNHPLVAFNMGKIGEITRIDCLAKGALWTYCSVGKSKTASGQMDLVQMKKIKKYCVIGNPIKHSMSPAMHNENFRALKINAHYSLAQVKNLKKYIDTITPRDISGVNVTIPHKIEAMKYLDKIDPLAKKIGAINTIHNKNGKLVGYNTDAYGALMAIKEKVSNIKNKKIVLLGSGGAARAIYFILKQEKAKIIILAEDMRQARELGVSMELDDENIKKYISWADILINCTPVGMNTNESLVKKEYVKKELTVFDIVYTPLKTRLIKDAEDVGCKTILGYKMLAFQGAKAFEIWTGKKANTKVMLKSVKGSLLPNIALVGSMGSGKTTVGKNLTKKLKRSFVDIDEEIEKQEKTSITNIFQKYGEKYFRNLETKMLLEKSQEKNLVISCGGGIVINEKNRKILKSSLVFLLKAKPETIVKRLKNNNQRPLLKGLSDQEKINKIKILINERNLFYEDVADYSMQTNKNSQKEIVEKINKLINKI